MRKRKKVDTGKIFYRLVKIEQELRKMQKEISEDNTLSYEQNLAAGLLGNAANYTEEARSYIRER